MHPYYYDLPLTAMPRMILRLVTSGGHKTLCDAYRWAMARQIMKGSKR